MNVFKLLSRNPKGGQSAPTLKLPSSGAVANPQLFGHDEPPTTSTVAGKTRKRKRGRDAVEDETEVPADIDFFGGGVAKDIARDRQRQRSKSSHIQESAGADKPVQSSEEGTSSQEIETYNEDECKRVLRSHKLKVTVLEDFAPAQKERKKERKSKKRKHKEEESAKSKKTAKRQLYPVPLSSFTQLRTRYKISRRLAENIMEQGYKLPTEVQLGALPLLLNKEERKSSSSPDPSGGDLAGNLDLLTVAPTGSGKTVAFLIPIISSLLSEGKNEDSSVNGPRAVIVAPTKELASQIVNEARKLAVGTGIKAVLVKKGIEVVERDDEEHLEEEQEAVENPGSDDSQSDLENETSVVKPKRTRRRSERVKAAILVATPLALVNALRLRDGSISKLSSIRHLTLDEADVLLDPLFREQVLQIWNACTNPLLRVALWSATMGSNIESLVVETLNTRWVALSSSSSSPLPPRPALVRLVVGLKDTAIPNITHQLTYAATEQGKLLGLRQLLHPTVSSGDGGIHLRPPFLVFTQTIARAIALHSELLYDIPHEAGGSSRIAVLHADLSSAAREGIMTRFRRGEVWVLITTDLLARGVDFRGLNGVVNYDVPNSAAAYIHRVGRTGRAGREGGVAVTFYTQEDVPYIKNVANVIRASEKLRGKGDDEVSVQQWLLDALPTPSKRDKQQLKKKGIEARRTVKDAEGRTKNRISTKSGYERRIDNNLKGAKLASRRREQLEQDVKAVSESEFEGFDD